MAPLVSLLRLFLMVGGCSAAVRDSYWDCQFRQLAADYARDIVLASTAGWSAKRAHTALATVAQGLNLSECNLTHTPYEGIKAPGAGVVESGDEADSGVTVYVSTSGSDAAAGTAAAPLKTIAGAQAWIRARSVPPPLPTHTQHITSHHTTPHHIASHHITSHHITSHHITSHHITFIASHHITSHHIHRITVSVCPYA